MSLIGNREDIDKIYDLLSKHEALTIIESEVLGQLVKRCVSTMSAHRLDPEIVPGATSNQLN